MNVTVESLLSSFHSLPDHQKHELASEILRWSMTADNPPLQDDELVQAADEVFCALDEDELVNE
jgi:hypothetical protein